MNSTNPNRENATAMQYSHMGAQYMHETPNFKTLGTMTSAPFSAMYVLDPFDRTYKKFIDAFNNNMLHPNQNEALNRNYYTINSAYGEAPLKTQTLRSCSGTLNF